MSDVSAIVEENTNRFIQEMYLAAYEMHPKIWRRVRFAVSPAEHEAIRRFFLEHGGVFHARVADVPLIVEENPFEPQFMTEIK